MALKLGLGREVSAYLSCLGYQIRATLTDLCMCGRPIDMTGESYESLGLVRECVKCGGLEVKPTVIGCRDEIADVRLGPRSYPTADIKQACEDYLAATEHFRSLSLEF